MDYKCRFCCKFMERVNKTVHIYKGGTHVARNEFWQCKNCGVYIKELLLDNPCDEIKEFSGQFEYEIDIAKEIPEPKNEEEREKLKQELLKEIQEMGYGR